ncbi:MAG: ABC transporter substrate-binding protein [Oscillospiraceae bacterium]|jgi:iron(III) transport system substrate-binding protein
MKSKQIIAFTLMVCFILMAAGCGSSSSTAPAPADSTPQAASSQAASSTPQSMSKAEPVPEAGSWADIHKINDGSETVEELYEKAKEEGTVVLYSISSRCVKVKESFEAQYPGIVVEAYDISTNELMEKITREYESGIRNADVIHCKDQDGSLYVEKVTNGIFHNYRPNDIITSIENENYLKYAMPLYIELDQWFYNYEVYDSPPIDSWWDVTRPEWKGKIILNDPLQNQNLMCIFTAFTQHPELVAEDYKREFGEDIVLSEGVPTAAHELFKRLMDNNPIFTTSSDEVCEAVGTPGQTDPPIGYAASSKLRKNESEGWVLAPINILPATGIPAQNNLYIVNEAPHPNAAKLLVRWMCGETDGKGKGFDPFNTLGGFSVRNNVPPVEGNAVLSEQNLLPFDPEYIYNELMNFQDFWLTLQK